MKTLRITILISLITSTAFAQGDTKGGSNGGEASPCDTSSTWKYNAQASPKAIYTMPFCGVRVGVGVKNPVEALDVYGKGNFSDGLKVANVFEVKSNGHVFAQDMTIQMAPFPDYVFAKEYELMSLQQLGDYINKNKHLPNMPTAKNVEVEGISVGDLQLKLVEKVEELTLYIIDLQKQINTLKTGVK